MATRPTKTRLAPDLNDVLALARQWAAAAFPGSPAGALVVVPADGLPAVVLPLTDKLIPACIATHADDGFDHRG